MRRIELEPWDTEAWTGLVKEAQNNRGGGMSLKDVLRCRIVSHRSKHEHASFEVPGYGKAFS